MTLFKRKKSARHPRRSFIDPDYRRELEKEAFYGSNHYRHYADTLKAFLLSLFLFTCGRLLFFIFNTGYFAGLSFGEVAHAFVVGLLFDLSAAAYINVGYLLLRVLPFRVRYSTPYRVMTKLLYVVGNAGALFFNIVDVEYFGFSGRRSGAELLRVNYNLAELMRVYLYDYWYLVLFFFYFVYFIFRFYPATRYKLPKIFLWQDYLGQSMMALPVVGLTVLCMRGGLQLIPLQPADAATFVSPRLVPLTLNTPFQMMMTLDKKPHATPQYFASEKEFLHYYNPAFQYVPTLPADTLPADTLPADSVPAAVRNKAQNVFIIILESFGKEYVGMYDSVPGTGYTPFLDSIARRGLFFRKAYASGKRSIDAVPSILSGLPALMDDPLVNSVYQSNAFTSLGSILRKNGYRHTEFMHGGHNGTMSFDAFIGMSDFGTYAGRNEYPEPKHFDGAWGIYDHLYLRHAAEKATGKEPFCISVFTLSSHHPYALPDSLKERFAPGSLPIHRSVRYADYALKNFFEAASRQPWFENTLFVITADHSAEFIHPHYGTLPGRFEVPLVLYAPGDTMLSGVSDKTVSHSDIPATVLSYLEIPGKFSFFGKDMLDTTGAGMAVQFQNGVYQLIQYPYVLQFDGSKTIAFLRYTGDYAFETCNEASQQKNMENLLKAYIQSYFHTLNQGILE